MKGCAIEKARRLKEIEMTGRESSAHGQGRGNVEAEEARRGRAGCNGTVPQGSRACMCDWRLDVRRQEGRTRQGDRSPPPGAEHPHGRLQGGPGSCCCGLLAGAPPLSARCRPARGGRWPGLGAVTPERLSLPLCVLLP